jgi:hypothetical protein
VEGGFFPVGQPEDWQRVIDRATGIGERRPVRLGEFSARYRVRMPTGELRHYLVAERPCTGGSRDGRGTAGRR